MAKQKKNLRFPVIKVKEDGKVITYAVVSPKIDIREGIPRRTRDGETHDDVTPKKGVFTAEQVAKDPEISAYLVSINSGALRKIDNEDDIAVEPDEVEQLQAENEALRKKIEELEASAKKVKKEDQKKGGE